MPIRNSPIPWPVVLKPGTVRIDVMAGNFPSDDLDMDKKDRAYNQYFAAGCGLITAVSIIALAGFLILLFARDRQAARYPGSIPLSAHSNYKGLPYAFRWDNSYRTSENFKDVFNWYSVTFDLGAEARAMSKCTLLEGSNSQLLFSSHISVFLCSTDFGQMIYVTRSTFLTGRPKILSGVEDLRRSLFFARPRPGGQ